MKTIKFSPLRMVKKSGKITVSSYVQWRKVIALDYCEFNLILTKEHLCFPLKERVYNHKGELLFWYNHKNPEQIPKNFIDQDFLDKIYNNDSAEYWKHKTEPVGKGFHYSIKGFDCDGIPVFSHYTLDYIVSNNMNVIDFEILTVEMVLKWYGWFLYQLNNSNLIINQ